MTNEERLHALHARAAALRRKRERRKTGAVGASCIALAVCLVSMIYRSGGIHSCGAPGLYSGSTLLFEGAGPYVLIAITAFMAGVIVAVVLIRNRKKKSGEIAMCPEPMEENIRGTIPEEQAFRPDEQVFRKEEQASGHMEKLLKQGEKQ